MILARLAKLVLATLVLAALLAAGGAVASELTVLARENYLSPGLLRKFERETGIAVKLTEVANYHRVVQALATGQSGFDIAFSPDFEVEGLIQKGRIERVLADRLTGFWNVEDPWRSRFFDPRNEYTIPHQWGTAAFAVDTSIHRGDIDSLKLLFEPPPELDGHIALLDEADMVQLALVYLGEPRCTVDGRKLARAERLLRPLLARNRLVPAERMMAALADPGIALAVVWNGDAMRARDKRPSLAYAYPREGNLVWTDVAVVPRRPPNRANALKFLTFLMQPENAALDSNFNGYANMIRGSERYLLPSLVSAPELVAPWPAKVGFLPSCDGVAEIRHQAAWDRIKEQGPGTPPEEIRP
jgi:spermidine/putrescine transport system substrate-binding protein